jgi:AraC-like DNA-binding protein
MHDGGASTDAGFGYSIVYIDPKLIHEALGGASLPFVSNPIVDARSLGSEFVAAVRDIDDEIDEIKRMELAVSVADMLRAAAADGKRRTGTLRLAALLRVRELLAANPAERHSLAELERLSDLDRWSLARQFRAAFGTSPSRFRTMRQLDHARRLLKDGISIAMAAVEAGFADQSHMSRQFKRAYGLTPAGWVAALLRTPCARCS